MTTTDAVHYQPSREILDRYAEVLVRFALGSGRGIQPGEMVYIRADEVAKPLLESVHDAVVDADGHPHVEFVPEGMLRRFLERGSETQLGYWPKNLELGRVADAHHRLGLFIYDPREFDGLEASRYGAYRAARKELTDAWTAKELRGEHTWSLCLYPTDRQAREAGLSLEESWAQVIKACYLDDSDPVRRWREVFRQLEETKQKLDARGIESLRVRGEGIDLRLRIGDGKRWQGGEGRNIPSFEIFNTPDCRVGEGEVHFDLPGFHHGQVIRGAQLRFEAGRVVEFSAEAGAEVLAQIVGASGGDRLGEFSLTDRRLSRIDRFMASTLYDENYGPNMHLALGQAYFNVYPGDGSKLTEQEWEALGYNDSTEHADLVTRGDGLEVTNLTDGRDDVIYKDGEFTV